VELQAMVPFVIQDKGKWCNVPGVATLGPVLLDVVVENKDTETRYKDWDNESLTKDQIKYACTDSFMPYKITEMLQSEPYDFDLHVSQSPIPAANSTDSDDDGGGQQVLRFVENQQTKKIDTCPACPGTQGLI
jgi:hypothetical protein